MVKRNGKAHYGFELKRSKNPIDIVPKTRPRRFEAPSSRGFSRRLFLFQPHNIFAYFSLRLINDSERARARRHVRIAKKFSRSPVNAASV